MLIAFSVANHGRGGHMVAAWPMQAPAPLASDGTNPLSKNSAGWRSAVAAGLLVA